MITRIGVLLGKDVRILRRSPFLLAALVLYPLAIALLVGLVARFANDRPRVAFVDLDGLPEVLSVGGEDFNVDTVLRQVRAEVDLIPLSQEEADHRLANGEVVAQIIVPSGFASRLRGMVQSPTLILRATRGGLSGRVERQTEALVFNLNRLLQKSYIEANLEYVDLIRKGGEGSFLGDDISIVGLQRAGEILAEIERDTDDPEIAAKASELRNFVREALLALDQSGASLRAVANPIELRFEDEDRRAFLLTAQVQAYALALTLAFLCILIAAAGIAAERDENVIGRLTRGLVRLGELIAEKIGLAALLGLVFGLGLALVFSAALALGGVSGQPWGRLPLLAVGLVLGGAAFGAFGVFLGVLAREARTASLVALLVALPIVLLGFLPEASVAPAAWVSNAFPFAHSVRLFESSLYDLSPWGKVALPADAAHLHGDRAGRPLSDRRHPAPDAGHPRQLPVGDVPAQSRRADARDGDRHRARLPVVDLCRRSAGAHQSRHSPPPCAADGQRSPQDRTDELAADVVSRYADRLLRRRDRHGRQHLPRRPQRRAHADAMVAGPQWRLFAL